MANTYIADLPSVTPTENDILIVENAEETGKATIGNVVDDRVHDIVDTDIATLQEDVSTLENNLAETDRTQKNIIKALIGSIIEFNKRTYTLFKNLINQYALSTTVEEIDGRSVVVNQYAQIDDSVLPMTSNGVTVSVSTSGTGLKINGTATGRVSTPRQVLKRGVNTITGHYYFIDISKNISPFYLRFSVGFALAQSSSSYITQATSNVNLYASIDSLIDISGDYSFDDVEISIVDLTTWFGSGNGPTLLTDPKIAEVKRYLAEHPNYDGGSIKSAKVDKIVVQGTSLEEEPQEYFIPLAVQQLDGYGESAGSVSNYVDYVEKKYHKKVVKVNLGELDWISEAEIVPNQFRVATPSLHWAVAYNGNGICDKYLFVPPKSYSAFNDKELGYSNSSEQPILRLKDSNFSDVTSLKQALQDVYMYVETSQPTITDISDLLEDFESSFNVEGNGTITLNNEYQLDLTSKFENMEVIQ